MRQLLKEDGADPSMPGGDNPARLPLCFDAGEGRVECARLLLEHNILA